jgi:hypothetical protein
MSTEMNQRSAIFAAIVMVVTSLAIALVFFSLNNWFGAGDIPAFIFWSLPAAGIVYASFGRLPTRVMDARAPLRFPIVAIIGGALGLVWTIIAGLLLGGWILAFGVPVLLCWIGGGMFAGVAAAWHSDPRSWPAALLSSTLIVTMSLLQGKNMLEPEPHVRVVLRSEATHADVDRFWTEVIGNPGRRPGEHSFIEGVWRVGIVDYKGGRPVFDVGMKRGISRERRDSIFSRIHGASFVARLDTLP